MDELDLDAFIANMEESAPQEDEIDQKAHLCQECDIPLENIDGEYICPNCSAKATNILQLEATELHFDEMGRMIGGQRVSTARKKSGHSVDYGWAWSTDEAIVHILSLQLDGLEKFGLVPESFREGAKNMWFKFWVENIAPYIRDEYNENDLVPLQALKTLKMRDIEVLIRVRDKVMLPKRMPANSVAGTKGRTYRMLGTRFYKCRQPEQQDDDDAVSDSSEENLDPANRSLVLPGQLSNDNDDDPPGLVTESKSAPPPSIDSSLDNGLDDEKDASLPVLQDAPLVNKPLSKIVNLNSISILTLNRTIAFIEATARCMNLPDPIFASDIIRACNQRLIPFFGAHKTLPEGMNLNANDLLTFRRTRPPTAHLLTRAACLLIHKIYHDRLPVTMPVPKLDQILERFLTDMNLPQDLLKNFNSRLDFSSFKQTRPIQFHNRHPQCLPQYDRWAFAILISQMKLLFGLDDISIQEQSLAAQQQGEGCFVLKDWVRQMTIRLQLIVSYDPFMLFHPMTDMRNVQHTPQLHNYIETILHERITTQARSQAILLRNDETFRSDLADFLKREIPRPSNVGRELPKEQELEMPVDTRHPILDSFKRTQRFWESTILTDNSICDVLFADFASHKTILLDRNTVSKWSIYDVGLPTSSLKYGWEVNPEWPHCFKLLLSVGGFLCYCEPKELLNEVKFVEEFLYPSIRHIRLKRKRLKPSTDNDK